MYEIKIEDSGVMAALNRLLELGNDLTPVMRAISAELFSQTEANFAAESGPLGKWPALKNPSERRAGGQILQDTGRLVSSITAGSDADSAWIGTNVIYAAIHQFGGKTSPHTILPRNKKALAFGGRVVKKANHPGSDIPARPFMPVTPDGRLQPEADEAILDIVNSHMEAAATGRR